MKLLEYEAVKILKDYQVPVIDGRLASNTNDVLSIANIIGYPVIIKAQIKTGGRGKAGGVKIVKNKDEAQIYSNKLIGSRLVTKQTDSEGLLVEKVFVCSVFDVYKEYYLSIMIDKQNASIVFVLSIDGGMDIEKTAKESPEKIYKFNIYYSYGLLDFQLRAMCYVLDPDKHYHVQLTSFFRKIYNCYIDSNAQLIEINPLAMNKLGELSALDIKMDLEEKEGAGMSFVRLTGNIGCMVNGAGLAMATMDLIKYKGGEPANFLDVGGGANEAVISRGFDMIQEDSQVKVILINIFGGIVHCDVVAYGIIASYKKKKPKAKIVVRLEGTNAVKGLEILSQSNLDIIVAEGFEEAVLKSVSILNK